MNILLTVLGSCSVLLTVYIGKAFLQIKTSKAKKGMRYTYVSKTFRNLSESDMGSETKIVIYAHQEGKVHIENIDSLPSVQKGEVYKFKHRLYSSIPQIETLVN